MSDHDDLMDRIDSHRAMNVHRLKTSRSLANHVHEMHVAAHNERTKDRGKSIRDCCVFCFFGCLVVPVIIFAISSVFALILWGIECEEAIVEFGTEEEAELALPGQCTYYEWWKYVIGNLVQVQGLTDVGPESDHVVSEMTDILVATWSLTLAGACVGLIGTLKLVHGVRDKTERTLDHGFQRILRTKDEEFRAVAASGSGIDFDEYLALIDDGEFDFLDADKIKGVFGSHQNAEGRVGTREVEGLVADLNQRQQEEYMLRFGTDNEIDRDRMDRIDEKIEIVLEKTSTLMEAKKYRAASTRGFGIMIPEVDTWPLT